MFKHPHYYSTESSNLSPGRDLALIIGGTQSTITIHYAFTMHSLCYRYVFTTHLPERSQRPRETLIRQIQHGFTMDSIRTLNGCNIDSIWIQYAFNMDSLWIEYGLGMD